MLSSDHHSRLQHQLIELSTIERPRLLALIAAVDGKDPADQADRMTRELDLAQVDVRIERLIELLAAEEATGVPTEQPGSLVRDAVLVLDFGNGPETFRFSALDIDDGVDVVTPDSPLGRALSGAAPGQRVTYRAPHGETSVTLVSVGLSVAA